MITREECQIPNLKYYIWENVTLQLYGFNELIGFQFPNSHFEVKIQEYDTAHTIDCPSFITV